MFLLCFRKKKAVTRRTHTQLHVGVAAFRYAVENQGNTHEIPPDCVYQDLKMAVPQVTKIHQTVLFSKPNTTMLQPLRHIMTQNVLKCDVKTITFLVIENDARNGSNDIV